MKTERLIPYSTMPKKKREESDRPGWYIIEKYMLKASSEEQEAAYVNLRWFVKLLIEIDDRVDQEHRERDAMLQPPLF